jgi:hypothetical protein
VVFCATCSFSTTARAGGGAIYNLTGIELLVHTSNPLVDNAERYALAVLGADFNGTTHVAAANYYGNPWIRDSYAWGMVPSGRDSSVGSYSTTELSYWLARPQPFGGWLTARQSGYFDETPDIINAVLDSYEVTGDLGLVKRALPALIRGWWWLARGFIMPAHGSNYLIYANVPPHVSADWVDQVARHGYATQLEALWYWATRSLGIMEELTGHRGGAAYYTRFAQQIRSDLNRLLWTTEAPYVVDAPAVPSFGHYRSWVGSHGYFELDSNLLCVPFGIADKGQTESIAHFIKLHDVYLLGVGTANVVPGKVLYGDYAPVDYAGKHERLGPGRYQNGYWPTVGALAAMGMAAAGDVAESQAILQQLGNAFTRDQEIREWYTSAGAGQGAPTFQWAARMFIVALYAAYLGISDYAADRGRRIDAGIKLEAPAGAGSADVLFHGRSVHIVVGGQGTHVRLDVSGQHRKGEKVPGTLLCAGCTLYAAWG